MPTISRQSAPGGSLTSASERVPSPASAAGTGQRQTSALNRWSARLRFVMKAIDVCWRRGGRAVDEVARIAERVGKEGRPYDATKAAAQPSKGAIDVAIVLPPEVLQDFFP